MGTNTMQSETNAGTAICEAPSKWPVSVLSWARLRHVFNFHRGVVHKDTDGQRQPSQGHDVESLAQGRKTDDRAKNG